MFCFGCWDLFYLVEEGICKDWSVRGEKVRIGKDELGDREGSTREGWIGGRGKPYPFQRRLGEMVEGRSEGAVCLPLSYCLFTLLWLF